MMGFGYYAYPWNLHDPPADVARMRDAGMAHITVATSYHAGRFLQPRDPVARIYFPEDGTIYFHGDPRRYGELQPKVADVTNRRDTLRTLCDVRALPVRGWTVLNHNSRLGWKHPETVVRNAWGDPYYYSLCPSHPAVREYAVALCADLASAYDLETLLLETPGWLTFEHGYHHEVALRAPDSRSGALMGICFCDCCVAGAGAAGIDAAGLRRWAADCVDAWLTSAVSIDEPDTLAAYHRWRCDVVTGLCREIRAAVRSDVRVRVISTCQRPHATCHLEGGDLHALDQITDGLELPLYQPTAADTAKDLDHVLGVVGAASRLSAILRPSFPDMASEAQLQDTVARVVAAGVNDISFYNFGMLPAEQIGWVERLVASSRSDAKHA